MDIEGGDMDRSGHALFLGSFELKLDKETGRVRLPKRWRGSFGRGIAFVQFFPMSGCIKVAPTQRALEDSSGL